MNSRERVKRAIAFDSPDRVPISHAVLPAAILKYGNSLLDILTEFTDDFGWDHMDDLPVEKFKTRQKLGTNKDKYGTTWYNEVLGMSGIPIDVPVKNLEQYKKYKWPVISEVGPPAGRLYSGHVSGYDDRWYARGGWITFFEQLQQIRGMENFFMDIALEPIELYQILDDMLIHNLNLLDQWTALEYDGIHFADDWGEQNRMLINPKVWRRIFKPYYNQMFKKVHDAKMDVWFHSDGFINNIIPDLIEIGIDVINCQETVIGREWIEKNVRGKLAFRTDINRQYSLPFGTPTQVKEEVYQSFEACGTSSGGIIACGEIGPDVPLENIRAMYEAFAEYGSY